MPLWSDPAPCAEGEKRYECPECGTRVCSDRVPSCERCGAEMRNISVPRPE